jgi:hypothetical protein
MISWLTTALSGGEAIAEPEDHKSQGSSMFSFGAKKAYAKQEVSRTSAATKLDCERCGWW